MCLLVSQIQSLDLTKRLGGMIMFVMKSMDDMDLMDTDTARLKVDLGLDCLNSRCARGVWWRKRKVDSLPVACRCKRLIGAVSTGESSKNGVLQRTRIASGSPRIRTGTSSRLSQARRFMAFPSMNRLSQLRRN